MIYIIKIYLCMTLVSALIIIYHIIKAPSGYEDENGFHSLKDKIDDRINEPERKKLIK